MSPEFSTRRTFLTRAAAGAAFTLTQLKPARAGANDTLNVGLIGAGSRNNYLLDRILENVKDVRIVAVCDLEESKVASTSAKVEKAGQPKPKGYFAGPTDYCNLLDDKGIDAVIIATPCDMHAPMYLDAMERNKHMYGEKPMCITVGDCNRLMDAHKKTKAKVQIGFQKRCNPCYIESVKLVKSGEIGVPIDARGAMSHTWGPLRGWFSLRARSGDWMLEQACHSWDVFNWVFGGPPLNAYGRGRRDIFTEGEPNRDVTDYYTATIEWPGRVVVDYIHCWFCSPNNGFDGMYERVAGLKGGVELGAGKFTYREKGKPEKRVGGDPDNDSTLSLRSFFDCIRNDSAPLSSVPNGRDATLAGLLVRMAVDEQRTVTMEEMLKKTT